MKKYSLMIVMALVVAACTGGDGSSDTTGATPVPTTVPADTTAPPATDDDPVQAQLEWFVRTINGGPLSADVYGERFAEVFRLQVPFDAQFQPIVEQLEAVPGNWIVVSYTETGPESGVGILAAGDERMQVSLSVQPDEPHLIEGLLVQPADLPSTPDSFENAINRLEDLGTLRMLGAEVVDGQCLPVTEVAADEAMPLGSVFKLFVLGTLADAVAAGEISWDDEIVIRDELKSIPSGILQDEADGTVKTVREVAELMISISDNTATDHLIDLLGRERIEAHLPELGLTEPELNVPFLTTRELTALKVGPSAGLGEQYVVGDVDARRAILEQISDIAVADLPIQDLDEPIRPDTLEWFASPADMCTVFAGIWADGDDTVREILTSNPGVAPAPGVWDEVAFKGGSEPGLLAVAWLTVAPDGRVFVLNGSVLDTGELIDEMEAVFVFAGARDLLVAPE
ncbi:MAG: serine hydrolase [Acidimicrobiia bacterium]